MANVEPGAYAIWAKAVIDHTGGSSSWTVTCSIFADGTSLDYVRGTYKNTSGEFATLNAQAAHVFAATGSITLRCRSGDWATATISKVTAIKVGSVAREAVSG
jgi:hypothetical protein